MKRSPYAQKKILVRLALINKRVKSNRYRRPDPKIMDIIECFAAPKVGFVRMDGVQSLRPAVY